VEAARFVEPFLRDEVLRDELLGAPQLRLRKFQRRLRLIELRFDRGDLRRTPPLLKVRELRFRRPQPLFGFAPCRRFVLAFEREERRTGVYFVASPHMQPFEPPGERRRDAHVLAFGIALEDFLGVLAAAGQHEEATDERRGEPRRAPCALDRHCGGAADAAGDFQIVC
jgi:hypothetical protein